MQPLITEAQEVARDLAVLKFAKRASSYDESRNYCFENIDDMVKAGLMGMSIPARYGGRGTKNLELVLIAEEIARHCALTARVFVDSNMGAVSAIMHYGNETQRQKVAARVLAGDKPATCITEPDAGSAASQMKTMARRSKDGYVINGCKHWVSGGGITKTHLVFAKVVDESGCSEGIGAFIIIIDDERHGTEFKVVKNSAQWGCAACQKRF